MLVLFYSHGHRVISESYSENQCYRWGFSGQRSKLGVTSALDDVARRDEEHAFHLLVIIAAAAGMFPRPEFTVPYLPRCLRCLMIKWHSILLRQIYNLMALECCCFCFYVFFEVGVLLTNFNIHHYSVSYVIWTMLFA